MRTGRMLGICVGFMMFVMVVGLAVMPAQAKSIRITAIAGHPEVAQHVKVMKSSFIPALKEKAKAAGYEVEIVEGFGGSVAKVGGVLEAVQDGLAEIGLVATPFEPAKLFMHNFFYYTPFSSTDVILTTQAAQQLYDEVPYLKSVFEKEYNQKLLAVSSWSSYELMTMFPVHAINDLKNHKIAAAGPNLPWISSVGAVPVQGNLTEGYTGMQTGVYEGWVMTAGLGCNFKFHELTKFFTKTDFGANPGYLMTVNLDFFNSLPPELQKIFIDLGREYAMELAKFNVKDDANAIETMKKAGVEIIDFPESDRIKWAESLPDLAQQACDKAKDMNIPDPALVINTWVKIQESKGHKWPRKWNVK